jgi:hypothetical protein
LMSYIRNITWVKASEAHAWVSRAKQKRQQEGSTGFGKAL